MLSGDDIKVKKVAIGLHNLSQQQQECHVLINDLEECLQSLLLDPRFPAKQRYFRTAEERGQYTTEDGEQVHGPECWHGEQWQDCEDTIPAGSRLLYIIVHSDETKSLRGSRYPFRLQIGNFAYGGRCKDFGNRLIGLGPLINIHRQRGSKAHIDLNDDQFACKANVYSLTPALILSDLNEVAKHVSTVNLWYPDGARRISVVVRVGIWSTCTHIFAPAPGAIYWVQWRILPKGSQNDPHQSSRLLGGRLARRDSRPSLNRQVTALASNNTIIVAVHRLCYYSF